MPRENERRTSNLRTAGQTAAKGVKRASDGTEKPAGPDEGNFRDQMIKKFTSNMRVYANNVINEVENINTQPQKATWVIAYESQKLAIAVKMLENILNKPTDILLQSPPLQPAARQSLSLTARPTGSAGGVSLDDRIEAIVDRIVDSKIESVTQDITDDVADQVFHGLGECVEEAVDEYWRTAKGEVEDSIRKSVMKQIMDEDMTEVKETVMQDIKARKNMGNTQDTQDQLRTFGDILN